MVQIKTLPLLQDAKFIVIDEGSKVIRATDLVGGWLQMFKTSGSNHPTNLLLFADPACSFEHWTEIFGDNNLKIYDYYTQDINNIYTTENLSLKSIVKLISTDEKSTVIVNCLSSLVLSVGLSQATKFIETLHKVSSQLICIYRRDISFNRIPGIETLGSTYVRLDKSSTSSGNDITYEVSVIHRKQGGGILKNRVLIVQDTSTYEIKSENTPVLPNLNSRHDSTACTPPKPQATFRIEISAREMEQRNKTPLPYVMSSANNSKILYIPDAVDDLDEEDPDDDLPF